MKFPVTESQVLPVVESVIHEGHKDDRAFVMTVWRLFIPALNEAFEAGKRAALTKQLKES